MAKIGLGGWNFENQAFVAKNWNFENQAFVAKNDVLALLDPKRHHFGALEALKKKTQGTTQNDKTTIFWACYKKIALGLLCVAPTVEKMEKKRKMKNKEKKKKEKKNLKMLEARLVSPEARRYYQA